MPWRGQSSKRRDRIADILVKLDEMLKCNFAISKEAKANPARQKLGGSEIRAILQAVLACEVVGFGNMAFCQEVTGLYVAFLPPDVSARRRLINIKQKLAGFFVQRLTSPPFRSLE